MNLFSFILRILQLVDRTQRLYRCYFVLETYYWLKAKSGEKIESPKL